MSQFSISSIPLIRKVDVLVVGGTTGGVAAALKAAGEGKKVFLVGGRSYLGEDICGQMNYWANEVPEILRPTFESGLTPMGVKLGLEQAVVEAKIPLVLMSYTAGVTRNSEGQICGVILANRAGLQRVEARMVVDASVDGMLSQQAGFDFQRLHGRVSFRHVTLTEGEGTDAEEKVIERPQGFSGGDGDGDGQWKLTPRVYEVEVDVGAGEVGDLHRAYEEIVARTWVPGEYSHQEVLTVAQELAGTQIFDAGFWSLGGRTGAQQMSDFVQHADLVGEHLERYGVDDVRAESMDCRDSKEVGTGVICTLTQGLRGGAKGEALAGLSLPHLGSFDVLVSGGGTGGAPAAISAAREGAETVVVEAAPMLGGVGTVGQIAKYWYGNRVGFTAEVDAGVAELEVVDRYKGGKGAWTIGAKAAWYHQQCGLSGAEVWLRSLCVGSWVVEGRVAGVVVAGPYGFGLVKAKCVIDSTGCADIPASAGAETRLIGGDHVAVQGTGLAGQNPGKSYNNSDHNFSDDTDLEDGTAFFIASKKKFAKDFDAGQLIDSRERRQILGEFSLGPADFMFERRFPDTICVASSNFDTHGFTIHPLFLVNAPHKERLWVDVPFRCLLPRGIERVLVTGLGISAHRDALPVVRMQPDVQNQGYAAGIIAARSAKQDQDLRELDLKQVQRDLVAKGNLPERVLTDEDTFPVSDEVLRDAVDHHWSEFSGLSLVFAESERALPMVRDALTQATDEVQRLRYAEVLGYLGEAGGKELLEKSISSSQWDEGWNYRGMGQFGMSMSGLDARIVALGVCGDESSWDPILEKIDQLPENPDFSHCRALVLAAENLSVRFPNDEASSAFVGLLEREGLSGHSQRTLHEVHNALTGDINENAVRNEGLRELHLARGLFRCGDVDGRGEALLREYADDLRGHFSRHARAVLAEKKALEPAL